MMKSPILARKAGMESCRGDPDVWVSSFCSDQRFDLDVLRRYIYIVYVYIYILKWPGIIAIVMFVYRPRASKKDMNHRITGRFPIHWDIPKSSKSWIIMT